MSADICRHGDLIDHCLDCTVAPPKPEAVPPALGTHAFAAMFGGHCSKCDGEMHAGDTIVAMTDGSYRHPGCVGRWQR